MSSLKYKIDPSKTYSTVYFVDSFLDTAIFMTNPSDSALPVFYTTKSTRTDFLDLVSKLPSVNRIGFVFDTSNLDNKPFLESETYFSLDDLVDGQTKFSKNVELLRTLPGQIRSIDFLCCNTLKNKNWAQYYKLLPQIIGASNDQTGNINGNWKMETTGEDVKYIYFGQGIAKYMRTLIEQNTNFDTTSANPIDLDSDCVLTSEDFDKLNIIGPGNKPSYFRVIKPIKIRLKGNINITKQNQCIVIKSHNVSIIGCTKSFVLINEINNRYRGLIMNGDGNTNNQVFNGISVSNIQIHANSSGLFYASGWIGQDNYGFGAKSNKFIKCTNNAPIIDNGSGIVGNNATCDLYSCVNNGDITSIYISVSGIIGSYALNCKISRCVNNGVINITGNYDIPNHCGGISGDNSENIIFYKCANTGNMNCTNSTSSGGLCGGNSSNLKFIGCVNTGNMNCTNSTSSGGLCGGNSSNLKFIGCVNKGAINSNAMNDYSSASYNGGLCGGNSSNLKFIGCVNKGAINSNAMNDYSSASYNGGLCGGNSSNLYFDKCANRGIIQSSASSQQYVSNTDNNAGICGGYSSYGILNKCKNYGHIVSAALTNQVSSSANGGLCGGTTTYFKFTECKNSGDIISNVKIPCSGSSNYNSGLCGGINTDHITLIKCINSGNINSTNSDNNNGLCGNAGNVQFIKCVNAGNINSTNSIFNSGFGSSMTNTTISNCINLGNVISDITSNGNSAFISGCSANKTNNSSISNSYNLGKVVGGPSSGNTNGVFISAIDGSKNISLSNSYSVYGPLVDNINSTKLLISTTGTSNKPGKFSSREASKYLLDGWVKSDSKHKNKPWGIN